MHHRGEHVCITGGGARCSDSEHDINNHNIKKAYDNDNGTLYAVSNAVNIP